MIDFSFIQMDMLCNVSLKENQYISNFNNELMRFSFS